MGIFQEKYTSEYYSGTNKDGKPLNFGATKLLDSSGQYDLRLQDRTILSQVQFCGKRVLCIGCGRGEEIVFALQNGAVACTGVDFSQHAIDISRELLIAKQLLDERVQLVCEDAICFATSVNKEISNATSLSYDIVIMLDFIEHLPRKETTLLLNQMEILLADHGILIVNTPAYKYDNDVILDGYDERNNENCYDTSDLNPATKGMHCNKYTTVSLQTHLSSCGFLAVTEAHFFIKRQETDVDFERISYFQRWNRCISKQYPIQGVYCDDVIEYPYTDAPNLELLRFAEGDLAGIQLLATKEFGELIFSKSQISQETIFELRDYIRDKSQVIIFDVGGYIGANALVYSRIVGPSGKVVVFEPNPYKRNRIFRNFSSNPELAERILVEPFALGESEGNTDLVLSWDIDYCVNSNSRIPDSHLKLKNTRLPNGFIRYNVEITTLDRYIEQNKIIPNVVKIDVDGAEDMVLQGATDCIKQNRPQFYIKYHSEYSATMCTQILISNGYKIYPCKEEADNRLIIKADGNPANHQLSDGVLTIDFEGLRLVGNLLAVSQEQAASNAYLLGEVKRLRERCLLSEAEAQSIRQSKVWKITAPLRRTLALLGIK